MEVFYTITIVRYEDGKEVEAMGADEVNDLEDALVELGEKAYQKGWFLDEEDEEDNEEDTEEDEEDDETDEEDDSDDGQEPSKNDR